MRAVIGRSGYAGLRSAKPKILADVGVEVELALLDQLHGADGGRNLGE